MIPVDMIKEWEISYKVPPRDEKLQAINYS